MTDNSRGTSASDELLDRIDALLWEDTYANDVRSTALIGLELGELIRSNLDDLQRNALDVAKTYWTAGAQNESEWLEHVRKIASRQDEHAHSGTHRTRAAYANRIVYTALNDRTGLSGFAGEFLVEIGTGAGLAADQIEAAFRKVLPALPPRQT